jgi:hypothetical protein
MANREHSDTPSGSIFAADAERLPMPCRVVRVVRNEHGFELRGEVHRHRGQPAMWPLERFPAMAARSWADAEREANQAAAAHGRNAPTPEWLDAPCTFVIDSTGAVLRPSRSA